MRSGRSFAIAASACSASSASVISQSIPPSRSRIIWRLSFSSSITSMRLLIWLHLPLNDDWKRESKSRTVAGLRLDANPSAVYLDDPLGYGKAQAGAALLAGDRTVGLLELLKQLGLIGSGNAGSGVTD